MSIFSLPLFLCMSVNFIYLCLCFLCFHVSPSVSISMHTSNSLLSYFCPLRLSHFSFPVFGVNTSGSRGQCCGRALSSLLNLFWVLSVCIFYLICYLFYLRHRRQCCGRTLSSLLNLSRSCFVCIFYSYSIHSPYMSHIFSEFLCTDPIYQQISCMTIVNDKVISY